MMSLLIIKSSIVVRFIFKRVERSNIVANISFCIFTADIIFPIRNLVSEGGFVFRRTNFHRIAECTFYRIRLSKLTRRRKRTTKVAHRAVTFGYGR